MNIFAVAVDDISFVIDDRVPIHGKECVCIDCLARKHQAMFCQNAVTIVRGEVDLFDVVHSHIEITLCLVKY